MTAKLLDLGKARAQRRADAIHQLWLQADSLTLGFTAEHCAPARERLGWSVEALAFRSGASVAAISDLEAGSRELRRVTMQALAFALEKEGLVFFPGVAPLFGDNCRGGTADPRRRDDWHLIE